jgi:hypothetical protein
MPPGLGLVGYDLAPLVYKKELNNNHRQNTQTHTKANELNGDSTVKLLPTNRHVQRCESFAKDFSRFSKLEKIHVKIHKLIQANTNYYYSTNYHPSSIPFPHPYNNTTYCVRSKCYSVINVWVKVTKANPNRVPKQKSSSYNKSHCRSKPYRAAAIAEAHPMCTGDQQKNYLPPER